jgi:Ala-tRNA(Pro) deacylase
MPIHRLKEYLDTSKVPYEVLTHPKAYTSQGVAAALHVRGREFAKCVIVKTDAGKLAMMVIPGPRHVDLDAAREVLGARDVELAREEEFAAKFPECELGAEPPFGNLYDMPVYVDESLRKDPEIVFNAGTHVETIRMKYADYEKLVHPVVARVSSSN